MSVAIKAENISKAYQIGEFSTGTITKDIDRWWKLLRGKEDPYLMIGETNDRSTKGDSNIVWSLKDINFEINQGDAVGIIGKNGAGKSTLLKVLSRVTTPTTGNIKVKGRIASLLEVGTGFHPELTGRENIYLNGAILGMRKHEIKKHFDAIVDFSGVERYIDTPVKRYSSGMYVRLAFAVAAHLESEILIVDEVLAVGDAEFQKKCLGKMGDVSKNEGRTILFVSHNMAAVKTLCDKGVVLQNGKVLFTGSSSHAVSNYLKGDAEVENERNFGVHYDKPEFKLNRISLHNTNHTCEDPLLENKEIELETDIFIKTSDADRYHITYHLYSETGEALFSFFSSSVAQLREGANKLICKFPESFFQSGTYYLSFYFVIDKRMSTFSEKDIMRFTVIDGGRAMGVYMGREPGFIKPKFKWENKI